MPTPSRREVPRRLVITLAAATLVAAAACSAEQSSDTKPSDGATTVKVGIIPIVDVAPLYLGRQKGFFDKRGLTLQMVSAQGGAAVVPGVVSGQFQFGFSNVTSLMLAQTRNVPVKGVVVGSASTGEQGADYSAVAVRKDSPVKTAKDLEGKKVAVNTLKNIGDTSVRESVRKAGGDPTKVRFVELAFDQMPAALAGGRIDAAWVSEPALATVKDQGGRVIASNYVDAAADLTVALYFTSAQYAQQHPDMVKKFREATLESLAYADSHPDEARDVLTQYTKIPQATLEHMVLPKWPAQANPASLATLAKLGRQDGLFDTAPDLDELLP